MQRNGRLSKSRFLCLYLIVVVMSLFEIPVRMKQRTARVTMVSALLANKRTFRRSCNFLGSREGCRAFSSMVDSRSNDSKETCPQTPLMSHRIGIIGGGLAGLSTAYHILEKCPSADITIMDRNNPGAGGASSVAGGLLHPLSPKGKLAFRGLEGLASSNKLVSAASQFEENVVLRNKIYRIANKENQVAAFQKTAHELPEIATWVDRDASAMEDDKDLWEGEYFGREKEVLGALKLSGDCKVLHMKSYLKGLWSYCESVGSGTKTWEICNYVGTPDSVDWKEKLADYDCVVFSAGSGLFHWSILDQEEYPMTLVRGQSIEMTMKDTTTPWNAILCGKYVSPLPENGRVIIGESIIIVCLCDSSIRHSNIILTKISYKKLQVQPMNGRKNL